MGTKLFCTDTIGDIGTWNYKYVLNKYRRWVRNGREDCVFVFIEIKLKSFNLGIRIHKCAVSFNLNYASSRAHARHQIHGGGEGTADFLSQ
jgi:hypothetical protein